MNSLDPLIPKHGGYRNLKSWQLAQLIYDLTVRFCDRYISKFSRTYDQMVQAARSGVQNIAEGSQASGTSRKTELKLTNVARASLEELKLDYEDYPRQQGLTLWSGDDPRRQALIDKRCRTAEEVAEWVREQRNGPSGHSGQAIAAESTKSSTSSTGSTLSTTSIQPQLPTYPELAANAILVLIKVASYLLDRQLKAQSETFKTEGGFTEKLYQSRKNR